MHVQPSYWQFLIIGTSAWDVVSFTKTFTAKMFFFILIMTSCHCIKYIHSKLNDLIPNRSHFQPGSTHIFIILVSNLYSERHASSHICFSIKKECYLYIHDIYCKLEFLNNSIQFVSPWKEHIRTTLNWWICHPITPTPTIPPQDN